ncbi:MAG: helix-turn-helix domain-containing protein [Acidipropionibacterium jensenii]|uniref:helix-turn-helix domain-containing protein n=1 Tax=Acidipropionibacterium jensenii TaxID=1749 RepID=UPI002646FD20|nr:helix-turn-helix domain-containing protein [Acidipropionibacterium jensenii]MDN5977274.1 helix-turn-helix domain-containing protein [Acidipropionibacterium jensenii]
MVDPSRGVLFPSRLTAFHRYAPPPVAADLVQWFWIPEWDLEPGVVSRQTVLSYPALNLVVEPHGVSLVGATTRMSERVLRGSGWAVGALLRPAAVGTLTSDASSLVDVEQPLSAPTLHARVVAAMAGEALVGEPGAGPEAGVPVAGQVAGQEAVDHEADAPADRHDHAVDIVAQWLSERAGEIPSVARHANMMPEVLIGEGGANTPAEAAVRLAVSLRTLQRMTHRYIGLPPAAIIRRRRLQEAAQLVREHPDISLATIAADLGYADHAHLTSDFRTVLGFTPSGYRTESS